VKGTTRQEKVMSSPASEEATEKSLPAETIDAERIRATNLNVGLDLRLHGPRREAAKG
jgi:hypothetical protein